LPSCKSNSDIGEYDEYGVGRVKRNTFPAHTADPEYPYFPLRERVGAETEMLIDGRLRELHLYDGSECNRACSFCCVGGSPRGWHRAFAEDVLELALELVAPNGMLKFYGGEPTLYPQEVKTAVSFCNTHGFIGEYRIYSNGVEADALLELLEFEPRMHAVLNYSILHGRAAKSIPRKSLARLLEARTGRIFSSHGEIEDTGAPHKVPVRSQEVPGHPQCWNCFPVLRSDGLLHACPFAVEIIDERFALGNVGPQADPTLMTERFIAALQWQQQVVDPEARRLGVSSCEVCRHHLGSLPSPFNSPNAFNPSRSENPT
jgi:MoaA/NifB/PqqE/SkfB family radical SAM enzyme